MWSKMPRKVPAQKEALEAITGFFRRDSIHQAEKSE
jgi:hypothetical protein